MNRLLCFTITLLLPLSFYLTIGNTWLVPASEGSLEEIFYCSVKKGAATKGVHLQKGRILQSIAGSIKLDFIDFETTSKAFERKIFGPPAYIINCILLI